MPVRLKEGKKPAEEVFQPHSIKDPEGRAKKFEETAKIQHSSAHYSINVPKRLEREMGFKKGSQVKVSLEGGRIVVEEEQKYISKVWESNGILLAVIHSNLLKRMESEEGEEVKWNLPDASTIGEEGREYRSFVVHISNIAAKEKNIKAGDQIEWVIRGRKLSIEPVQAGKEVCISTIVEVRTGPYSSMRHLSIYIPEEISDKLDKKKWGKGMAAGFEVISNGHKKLVITPNQA